MLFIRLDENILVRTQDFCHFYIQQSHNCTSNPLHAPPQCEQDWCLNLNPTHRQNQVSQKNTEDGAGAVQMNVCFGVTGAYEKRQAGWITRRSAETEQGPLLLIHTWSLSWLSRSALREGKHRQNQTRLGLCGAREAPSPADIRERR